MNEEITLTTPLVQKLIQKQFPAWATLAIKPVKLSGWDNRTFHLGQDKLIRLPSQAQYAPQVEKEQHWLPKLAPHLPLAIPMPLAMGQPSTDYPWHWSVYQWLQGTSAAEEKITDLTLFAKKLFRFLKALQHCDTTHAPIAGPDNFYRGGNLSLYDKDTRQAIAQRKDKTQAKIFSAIWKRALTSTWRQAPVWVHGDIATGNLLVHNGELVAVIDFGQLAVGDPACDLVLYWTLFAGESRKKFREGLHIDTDTWDRARGWALWKTLCAPVAGTDAENILNNITCEFESILKRK